jgi:IS605 OrfB family transposase
MKLVVQIKLLPDATQATQLLAYMRSFNAAAAHAARVGFDAGVFSQPSIHRRCYRELRETFGVSSQTAVRAIGKAAECFARDKTKCSTFKLLGAVTYDQRTFSFKGSDRVSLLTNDGRIIVPYIVGEYFKGTLHTLKGQADLVYRDGQFYLCCTADLAEPPTATVSEFLGVDLGIANIATDSTGERHTGADVERHRKRHMKARQSFQRKGTKSAKRRLKKLSGKQRRYQKHVNHVLSKHIVRKAKALGTGIAIEDLTDIRDRCEKTVRRKQRSRLSNWSFGQLRLFLTYKAKLAGIPLVAVDPRNTSRTCFVCGFRDKDNRKSQDLFSCLSCGHTAHADQNAARNIGRLGAQVNCPQQRVAVRS